MKKKPFFMRDPWKYSPQEQQTKPRDKHLGFDTRALHAGFHPLKNVDQFRAFVPPIVQSMTYPYEHFEKFPDYIYGRSKTPTVSILEERLAALEGGEGAVSAGSGSQALFSLISTIARPGDNIVTSLNIFGEGYKQAAAILPERCGVTSRFVADPAQPLNLRPGIRRLMTKPGLCGWKLPATLPYLLLIFLWWQKLRMPAVSL
jgi:O-acetylhomoserine/O-acetylserine sulfhydrylase-like pyridoxal-dependent enzyme